MRLGVGSSKRGKRQSVGRQMSKLHAYEVQCGPSARYVEGIGEGMQLSF